jgi:branched-chain amino acid transport system ATP-binding protein
VLEVRNLSVNYGAIKALHSVNVRVGAGEIVTLIGCNGAGKSTTLRAISGIVRAAEGEILFEGKPIHRMPPHEIVRLGIAQSPEGRGIFPNMTVSENLELGAFARPRSERAQIEKDRERALNLFPRLRERISQSAGTLSGGEQQMLAMARALLAKPRLLLLDEPSLGLAPQVVQTIFKIIREINHPESAARGGGAPTTVLLVEQNAHMALQVANRAYVLEVGRVVREGDAKELAASDEVRKAYLGVG